MRGPERGIHLVFVSKGEQDNKLTPGAGKKKSTRNKKCPGGFPFSTDQMNSKTHPCPPFHRDSEFPKCLPTHFVAFDSHNNSVGESSFPVVETEALRERRFAGNGSSEETVICSTLSE